MLELAKLLKITATVFQILKSQIKTWKVFLKRLKSNLETKNNVFMLLYGKTHHNIIK